MSVLINDGLYMIINAAGRTSLDLKDGSKNNGTQVQGWQATVSTQATDQTNQVWRIQYVETDKNNFKWHTFKNEASGTYLDLSDGKAANGTKVQGWQGSAGNSNQQWLLHPIQGGISTNYVIYNRSAWKNDTQWSCLDLTGGSSTNGTKVQGWIAAKPGGDLNQVWMLVKIDK